MHTIDADPRRLDLEVVHGFLTASYWAQGVDRATVRAMIAGAACCFGAYEASGRQVGFARVTSDRVRIAYLQDVFVVEAARGQGLGARLVEAALGAPALAAVPTWLLATEDAHGLYARFGFAPLEGSTRYMKLVRTPAAALPPPTPSDLPFYMSATDVSIRRLPHAEGLDLPSYATDGSAGMDLRAALPADAPVILAPGERAIIPTGLQIALPRGYEAQVRPRSGLAAKHGVTVLNSPGTIDADYRGEVGVILINQGRTVFAVERGERIAQLVVAAHARVAWQERDTLDDTERGEGGFGSTGR